MKDRVKLCVTYIMLISLLLICIPELSVAAVKSVQSKISPVSVKIDGRTLGGDKLSYNGGIYINVKNIASLLNMTYTVDKNGNVTLTSSKTSAKKPEPATPGPSAAVPPQSDPAPDRIDSGNWMLSTPEEQGIDSKILNSNADTAISSNYPAVTSLLVIRHGRLVYERYNGINKDSQSEAFSITKSITSALTGIAMQKGFIKSTDQKLADYFPEYMTSDADPRVKDITLEQMLTMTDGLESVGVNMNGWTSSADWFKFAIDMRMLSDPGTKFIYNTGVAHVMGGIVSKATNKSLKDFADENLFGLLGITNYRWYTDTSGHFGGGHLLYLTSRDMAKFGYLYLMNGKWNGKQVAPTEWVKETFVSRSDPGEGRKYGYFWWIDYKKDTVRNKTVTIYSANGFGGQYISVIPELDTVVVITCSAYHPQNKGNPTIDLIPEYIIPAIK